MVIYSKLLLVILNLLCMAINITVFFLIVRAIMLYRQIAWLKPFNDAGRGLVESYSGMVDRLWSRFMKKYLAPKGKLLVGLIALELVRLFIISISKLFN